MLLYLEAVFKEAEMQEPEYCYYIEANTYWYKPMGEEERRTNNRQVEKLAEDKATKVYVISEKV